MLRSEWQSIWNELRNNLNNLPRCPDHPEYPYIETLSMSIKNDILEIKDSGITVRSHRTNNPDFIETKRFQTWWVHLVTHGIASLKPGSENNPHPWRSCIVGAILAKCLDKYIEYIAATNEIKLKKEVMDKFSVSV